jgi:hypothetical protein
MIVYTEDGHELSDHEGYLAQVLDDGKQLSGELDGRDRAAPRRMAGRVLLRLGRPRSTTPGAHTRQRGSRRMRFPSNRGGRHYEE